MEEEAFVEEHGKACYNDDVRTYWRATKTRKYQIEEKHVRRETKEERIPHQKLDDLPDEKFNALDEKRCVQNIHLIFATVIYRS